MRNKLEGKIFGKWKVIKFCGCRNGGYSYICLCECGQERKVFYTNLVSGGSKSCGHDFGRTHGMKGTKIYNVWMNMRNRCRHINHPNWKYYGGRGVTVCARWKNSFSNFYKDMGDVPKDLTIDRINPYGNYEPSNCRWATRFQQANNQRRIIEKHLNKENSK